MYVIEVEYPLFFDRCMTENNIMEKGWLWEVFHVFILLVFLWHHAHASADVISMECSPWHNFQLTFQDLVLYRFLQIKLISLLDIHEKVQLQIILYNLLLL